MNKIIDILKKKKSIPLDEFINVSLYDKQFGYYMKKNPFGKEGDFITSPIISKLFSEMIAIWCVSFWEHLKKPKKILIVELGPGDGSLCKDLLKTFKKFDVFYKSLEINLLEKSIKLKKIQKSNIHNKNVSWIKSIDEIKYGPIIFLSNEFFDSLPIKQMYKKENLLFEKHVTLSNKTNELKFLYKKTTKKLIKYPDALKFSSSTNIIEYPIVAIEYLISIAKKIKKFNGSILTCDYGYIESSGKNTLRAIEKHKFKNIFLQPGSSDISSHINFKLFSEILKKNNLDVKKIITQSEFLQKMGIIKRANILSKRMTFKSKTNMYFRLKKLLDSNEMGNIFKILYAKKKGKNFSIGF